MNGLGLKQIVEAALLASDKPLSIDRLGSLFESSGRPQRDEIQRALEELESEYESRGVELVCVATGYRFQVRQELSPWISRLWEERPPKYSRALLETLAIIAYRQPVTRGDIEEIRGVSVSTNIIRTLAERNWVRVVGHKDVPGRPSLYATTRELLDYFNLRSLAELPSLPEIRALEPELDPMLDDGRGRAEPSTESEPIVAQAAAEAVAR